MGVYFRVDRQKWGFQKSFRRQIWRGSARETAAEAEEINSETESLAMGPVYGRVVINRVREAVNYSALGQILTSR
jgi:hypothetical protein